MGKFWFWPKHDHDNSTFANQDAKDSEQINSSNSLLEEDFSHILTYEGLEIDPTGAIVDYNIDINEVRRKSQLNTVETPKDTIKEYIPEEYVTNQSKVSHSRYTIAQIILVTDVDGNIHALNKNNGELQWTLPGSIFPPLIKVEADASLENEIFIIEPFDDGNIYYADVSGGIQKLPINVKQLALSSPIHLRMNSRMGADNESKIDDRIYISSRRSVMYKIDLLSGKILSKFGFESQHDNQSFYSMHEDDQESDLENSSFNVLLTRTIYEIRTYTKEGASYNITYSAWDENSIQSSNPQFQMLKSDTNKVDYIPLSDKSIVARNQLNGDMKWRTEIPNIAIGVFEILRDTTNGEHIPIQYPLKDVDVPKPDDIKNQVYFNRVDGSSWYALSGTNYPSLVGSASLINNEQDNNNYSVLGSISGVHTLQNPDYNVFYENNRGVLGLPAMSRNTLLLDPPNSVVDSGLPSDLQPPYIDGSYNDEISEQEMRMQLNRLRNVSHGYYEELMSKLSQIIVLSMLGVFALSTFIFIYSRVTGMPVKHMWWNIVNIFRANNNTITAKKVTEEGGQVEKRKRKRGARGGKKNKKSAFISNNDDELSNRVLQVSDKVLGYGSSGTVVYEGKFQERSVAVKRMLVDFYDIASKEIELLSESDEHPNVVRYYCSEETSKFLYIALELCDSNLEQLIETNNVMRHEQRLKDYELVDILAQITQGIAYLHSLNIIHRDIKPQNILISKSKKRLQKPTTGNGNNKTRIMLSDFGLCKKLDFEQSSFKTNIKNAAGTVGWMAPELLIEDENSNKISVSQEIETIDEVYDPYLRRRLTKAIDIFSLGCVFYYVLSGGSHPFGDKYTREFQIINGKKDFKGLKENMKDKSLVYEAVNILNQLLNHDPSNRPSAEVVLRHPFFWSKAKKLDFLLKVSDRLEIETRDPPSELLTKLENRSRRIIPHHDWCKYLDPEFFENLMKYRKYQKEKVVDLLRAIRNVYHHYNDLPEHIREKMGSIPNGFYDYFSEKYPHLLMEVHFLINKTIKNENLFEEFF